MNNLKPYKNYKPSNIAWLGNIPEHWQVIKLRFLSKITTGNKNTEDKVSIGRYNFYVRSQKIEKINSFSFEGEGILTAGDGVGVGKVFHYVNEKFDFHQRVYLFYNFPDTVNGKYLFYYLRNYLIIDLMLYNAKSTVDSVRLPTLKDFAVSIPPKEEQRAIANYLNYKLAKIDRFIQKKKQLIKLLNEQKAGIINDAVTKGLNPNAKMKPSNIEWLGDIPEHWEVIKLIGMCSFVRGNSSFKKDELLSNGKYVALQYGKTYKVNEVDEKYQFYVNDEFYKVSQIVNYGEVILISTSETIEDLGHSVFYNRSGLCCNGGLI